MNLLNNISSNQTSIVSSTDKENKLSQRGMVIWMTGLSGSGKTTLAHHLEKKLFDKGILTKVLDGDELRLGLNRDLGFSNEGRYENIRRTAELAKNMASCGIVVICSLITPTNELRTLAENIIGKEQFILYHIATPLDVCERRDVKGHYLKARTGSLLNFTGVSNPFEHPKTALFSIDTTDFDIDICVDKLFFDVFELIKIKKE